MSDKKKHNAPDAFQIQAYSGLDYLLKHKVMIFSLVAALLVLFGARIAYQYTKAQTLAKRQNELAKIDEQYNAEDEETGKKRQGLEKEIQTLTAAAVPPATQGKEPATPPALAPEVKKKIEDLRAQADAIEANHETSDKQYAEFFSKNNDNAEGWYAASRHVDYLLKTKKNDEARKILEVVAQKSKGEPFYEFRSKQLLAAIAEDAKDYDFALKATDELLAKASKELQPDLMLTKARLLMAKDSKKEANVVLDSLLKDHADSPTAEKARGLKSLIN